MANDGLTLTAAQVGQAYTRGETTAYVLNPVPGLANPEQNDAAVVLRVDHASVRYLLPSDADSTKVGHHGSSYSTSSAFLAAVQPEQAVISVGPNSYGHPAADTLQRLAAAGTTVWRTDQNGTITIVDDSASYTVQAEQVARVLFLPLLARSEATPSPTGTPTPTSTPSPTSAPTPAPSYTPPAGADVVCQPSGAAETCARVSQGNPSQNSTETVYGRLIVDGAPQSGRRVAGRIGRAG